MAYGTKHFVTVLLCSCLVIAAYFLINTSNGASASDTIARTKKGTSRLWFPKTGHESNCSTSTTTIIQQLQKQRDDLSLAMIQLSKEFHQYQCKIESNRIGSHGGWCSKGGKHVTDSNLASSLAQLFEGDTVASFGDGEGAYKKLIDESGKVLQYDSYDGAPFCENNTEGLVKYLDLSIPVYGLKLYDWIKSLEVAEHIPKKYEQIYLDNVVRHARKGIVLSWALPKQPGYGHVNGQDIEYVVNQLDKRGFYQDLHSSHKLQNISHVWWLKQNMYVYKRKPGTEANTLIV